jgi:cysteine desulfurase
MSTKPRIYLDFNATAPLGAHVRAAMTRAMEDPGNPSSIHAEGRRARDHVERARDQVAQLLARPREQVVFTSGGTEGNVLGILGLAAVAERRGLPRVVAAAAIDHPSLHGAVEALVARGWQRRAIPVTGDGALDVAAPTPMGATPAPMGAAPAPLGAAPAPLGATPAPLGTAPAPMGAAPAPLRAAPAPLEAAPAATGEALDGVGLLAIAAVNHELGTVAGDAVIAAARAAGALVHVDAVQAAGKLSLSSIDADILVISAHKLGGPQGVGAIALSVDDGLPLVDAGHQERGRRPGTENTLGIVGLGAAAAHVDPASWPAVAVLGDRLEAGLRALPGVRIHGAGTRRIGGTINAGFAGARGESIVIALDLAGVAVSTGAACTSGSVQPSPVLLGIGQAPDQAREAVRFSLGRTTTADDIDAVLERLPPILARARTHR